MPDSRMPDSPLQGILHIPDERKEGQLRDPANLLRPVMGQQGALFVPKKLMYDLQLRPGLKLGVRTQGRHVVRVLTIEDGPCEDYFKTRPIYDDVAIDPAPQIKLEHDPLEFTTRAMDLLSPVGFGQRGLIVAPPRVGKTILLQNMAKGIWANYGGDRGQGTADSEAAPAKTPSGKPVELMLLLVDERPEEVTDMRRNVPGVVYASSNDNTLAMHLELSQLVIERAKRRVEFGFDVIILLDSLTRLGRAFNQDSRSGKTMSGGMDSRAMEIPKKLFGSARKIENGGSLTILATCLIDTGSKMDQVIFEEFKGTGNMELTLDRKIADSRVYPAMNILQSGTRKEELLLSPHALECNRKLRRHLVGMKPLEGMQSLLDALKKVKTNEALYASMSGGK